MSEWWTYRLSDLLLFLPETYYRQFELYNAEIWPAQLLALAAGLAIFVLVLGPTRSIGGVVAALLAAAWLFVAWGYLVGRYAAINWAATYFAWGFVVEALLLFLIGVSAGRLSFAAIKAPIAKAGIALFVFGLLVQPLIGPLLGRGWSGVELFGIAPDPTVLATIGVLLAADRMRWGLLLIPLLWCAVSGATLWAMAAPDALLMPAAALLAIGLALGKRLQPSRGSQQECREPGS
jgi:uncharacterized protein DUF6064